MKCQCYKPGDVCNCEKTFDPNKPVQTRDGRKARIICTDAKIMGFEAFTILALVEHQGSNKELLTYYTIGGKSHYDGNCDLVNIKVKKWRWVYLANNGEIRMTSDWHTREEAKQELAIKCMYHVIGHVMETEIEE